MPEKLRKRRARHYMRMLDTAMRRAQTYPHPAGRIRRIETHISLVYLAGRFAYKVKKPVDLGFVNFASLSARRRACDDECRLNRRLAPRIYLGVTPIVRRGRSSRLGGAKNIIDYAVTMRRFDNARLFSTLLEARALDATIIERTAQRIARFHRTASHTSPDRRFGSAALVAAQLRTVLTKLDHEAHGEPGHAVTAWCEAALGRLAAHIEARRLQGFVRECHGDLHLQNIVLQGTKPVVFDCIEFDAALRWIDVVSDLAFLMMDLKAHACDALATHALNAWLAETGDYAGMKAQRLFIVYRALVRALVETLKQHPDDARRYLNVAKRTACDPSPCLLLCHGFSGSGKSLASECLAPLIGAVRMSSDTERKRGKPLSPPDAERLTERAYTPRALDMQYERLLASARDVLESGLNVIVDATFLKRGHRERFIGLADELALPVLILDFDAPEATLHARVAARSRLKGVLSDADLSVLQAQRQQADALSHSERRITETLRTDVDPQSFNDRRYWRALLERLDALRGQPAESIRR